MTTSADEKGSNTCGRRVFLHTALRAVAVAGVTQALGPAIAATTGTASAKSIARPKGARRASRKDTLRREESMIRANSATHDPALHKFIDSGLTSNLQVLVVAADRIVLDFCEGTVAPPPGPRTKVTPQLRFQVGSVGKPITATAVLKCLDTGRIKSLSDPVRNYAPEYAYPDHTILHLLTHSAGYTTQEEVAWPTDEAGLAEFKRKCYEKKAVHFAPGEKSHYYSVGYFILMDIVERLSGSRFEDFCQENIFVPAGMTHTTWDWRKIPDGERVLPWLDREPRLQTEFEKMPPTGTTGLWTTAGDLARFMQMVRGHGAAGGVRILGEKTAALMIADQTGNRFNRSATFWRRGPAPQAPPFGDKDSADTVGHPGYCGSISTYDPKTDLTFVAVTNSMKLHSNFDNYRQIRNALGDLKLTP